MANIPVPPVNSTLHSATQVQGSPMQVGQPKDLVPETSPGKQVATSIPTGLPHDQSSMLHDLASLALGYANPTGPGQVTQGQQNVLNSWKLNAQSDYSQYMFNQGMSGAVADPGALFDEEAGAAAAQWSESDKKGALQALGLSAKDWDEYQKLEEQKKKTIFGDILKVAEFAAIIAIMA